MYENIFKFFLFKNKNNSDIIIRFYHKMQYAMFC